MKEPSSVYRELDLRLRIFELAISDLWVRTMPVCAWKLEGEGESKNQ